MNKDKYFKALNDLFFKEVEDEDLEARVNEHIANVSETLHVKQMKEYINKHFFSAKNINQGYDLNDLIRFLEWL